LGYSAPNCARTNKAGVTIAGLFVVVWAAAVAAWQLGNVESRWDSGGPAGPPD